MNEPKFSIVIPTFNRIELLARCLERLAPGGQCLPDGQYEVIVTDDGGTAEDALSSRFPWVRWNQGPSRGPAANRNAGAKLARGEWLVFTDDDCIPSRVWLSSFAFAISDKDFVYEGRTTCAGGCVSPLQHAPVNLTGGGLWSCNFMVYRQLFEQVGGFDCAFPHPHMEDTEFKERLLTCARLQFVPDACVDHPPRRMPFGSRLAVHQESHVYYDSLHARKTSLVELLVTVTRCRTQAIRRHKITFDSFIAVCSLVVEVVCVAVKFGQWRRKYHVGAGE